MSALFEPGKIGKLETKNRLIRSATCEWMCSSDGRAGQDLVDFYRNLGQGGVGLIITGHAYITPTGKASPGQIGIYNDSLGEALKPVAAAIHASGAKAVVQINHAGRVAWPELNGGVQPAGPSAVPAGKKMPTPRELTDPEIRQLIAAYGQAARRVKAAGFDGVQLHGAHGYLISQFISPYTNRRTDRWGGNLDHRLNFLRAVCEEVRSQVGTDFPVLIKLASQDWIPGGLEPKEAAQIAAHLADFGIDAIEISGGIQEGHIAYNSRPDIREKADEAYFLDNARRIRDVTDLPLILVGGFRSPEIIDRALTDEGIEFVSLSRPLINDPELPNRWQGGSDERAACISCNMCLQRRNEPLRCWSEEALKTREVMREKWHREHPAEESVTGGQHANRVSD